jgi:putative ABC transport system permease protein
MFWQSNVADQVDEELDFHLAMVTRELVERGRSEPDARAEALRRFGDLAEVGARCRKLGLEHERNVRRAEYLAELRQDVRLALRHLQRAPAFTAVALLTLVLAIGANTAIFSAVSAVLLRPLPYPHAERLTTIWGTMSDAPRVLLSYPDLEEYRARNRTFDDIGVIRQQSVNLTGGDRPDRLAGAFVGANVLRLFGARAELGRLFTDDEATVGTAARVVVLSHPVWTSRFGADSGMVGRTLILNGLPHQVIGVTAAEFQDPFGPTEIWLPATSGPNPAWLTRENPAFYAVGRVRAGVSEADARADLVRIAAGLAAEYPATNAGLGINLMSLRDFLVGGIRPALLILLGFVALILCIACANIANLQLARATARRREMSLRAALGAGRARLVRQLLTESVVLALIGGTVGVLVARWGIRALVGMVPDGLPAFGEVGLDRTVLFFSLGITIGAGLVFGAVPARYGTRGQLADALQGRGADLGGGNRVRQFFVAVQLALCIVLLVGAGLLVRSFARLQQVPVGFAPDHLLTAELRLPITRYGNDTLIARFAEQALERLRATPGVKSAALVEAIPLSGNWGITSYRVEGRDTPVSLLPTAQVNAVSDGFFGTMEIPLVMGRDFAPSDRLGAPPVAIVNRELARRQWPGESPVGKRLTVTGPPELPVTVVGVVGNVKQLTLSGADEAQLYLAKVQNGGIFTSIAARTTGDPEAMAEALREAVWAVDRDQPVWKIRSMESLLDRDLAPRRFTARLTGGFALLALLLALIGVYGVMSYIVAQRTREIGIRMALGAARGEVVRMVLARGLRIVVVGAGLGLLAAYAGARAIERQLFGVPATDLPTFLAVPLALVVVAAVASWVPARRAARVDPAIALSAE